MSDSRQDILDQVDVDLTDGVSPVLDFDAHNALLKKFINAAANQTNSAPPHAINPITKPNFDAISS